MHCERSTQFAKLYLHRGNSYPQWVISNIRNNIVSFRTVPLKHRVYIAERTKHPSIWCCKGHRCWTDDDRESSTSVTSLPHSGNDGASSTLPGQSLHCQIELKEWRAKRVKWSQDTKYKSHFTLYRSLAGKNWLRAHFQFKHQIALIISKSIGTCAEPRYNRQSRR